MYLYQVFSIRLSLLCAHSLVPLSALSHPSSFSSSLYLRFTFPHTYPIFVSLPPHFPLYLSIIPSPSPLIVTLAPSSLSHPHSLFLPPYLLSPLLPPSYFIPSLLPLLHSLSFSLSLFLFRSLSLSLSLSLFSSSSCPSLPLIPSLSASHCPPPLSTNQCRLTGPS